MKHPIYLDHNATTPLDPRVLTVMEESLRLHFGNPSSAHSFGQKVRQQINQARRTIAQYLNVRPQEIIFTSGGTESVNVLLRGLARLKPKGHVISSAVEHSCVYTTLRDLESQGQPVTFLSPGFWGAVTPQMVREALRPETALIALMAVNNETGVKTDIDGVAAVAQEAGVPFFLDAVALIGKESLSPPPGVSALCFSGHKMHAPKGVGVLMMRSGLKVAPLLTGGGQEYGKRGGTENVAGILGLAEAVRIVDSELASYAPGVKALRDKLQEGILSQVSDTIVNGEGPRVGNTLNVSFLGIDGESLLIALDQAGLAVSHGSACASGALEPSRILLQMGIPTERAGSAMRLSLSRFTTEDEIDRALDIIVTQVKHLRK